MDSITDKVEVTGVWAAHDAGQVLFPQGAYGQLYGGITQGLGYALLERIDYDNGFIQSTNFDEYLIPTALDVPEIEAAILERSLSVGPFGAKNIAEPALVPTAPATLNALPRLWGGASVIFPPTWSGWPRATICAKPVRIGPVN